MADISKRLEEALKAVRTWSKERQDDAALLLEQMGAGGSYQLSDEERTDIEEAIAEARRGELATDQEVAAVFQRHGL
jgi:transposase